MHDCKALQGVNEVPVRIRQVGMFRVAHETLRPRPGRARCWVDIALAGQLSGKQKQERYGLLSRNARICKAKLGFVNLWRLTC
jgi:hypothetical protein